MCELFAICAESPIQFQYSLEEFAKHGGLIKPHKSGWGIAAYQGRDSIVMKEPEPAAYSPLINYIANNPIDTSLAIAHVRYATHGNISYENTHPFNRELGGRTHTFAHNGGLEDIKARLPLPTQRFMPIGETDSEYAFCYLLSQLTKIWDNRTPTISERLDIIDTVADKFRSLGTANFLYCDGEVIFAHSHKRRFSSIANGIETFGEAKEPGLCMALRNHVLIEGLKVEPLNPCQALMIASVPLTKEGWKPLPTGKIVAIKNGAVCNIDPE